MRSLRVMSIVNSSLQFRLIIICLLDTTFTQVLLLFWKESETIARPFGLHYNHYVSIRPLPVSENVYNSWTSWYIFYHILHTYACQHSLTTGMQNHPVW